MRATDTTEVLGVEESARQSLRRLTADDRSSGSKQSTNECSVDLTKELSGKIGATVLTALNAEIAGRLSNQIGAKIGEQLTESQTLHFSVGPKSAVLYRVKWLRNVRTGEKLYMANGEAITVPYRATYGPSFEVQTAEIDPTTDSP